MSVVWQKHKKSQSIVRTKQVHALPVLFIYLFIESIINKRRARVTQKNTTYVEKIFNLNNFDYQSGSWKIDQPVVSVNREVSYGYYADEIQLHTQLFTFNTSLRLREAAEHKNSEVALFFFIACQLHRNRSANIFFPNLFSFILICALSRCCRDKNIIAERLLLQHSSPSLSWPVCYCD